MAGGRSKALFFRPAFSYPLAPLECERTCIRLEMEQQANVLAPFLAFHPSLTDNAEVLELIVAFQSFVFSAESCL